MNGHRPPAAHRRLAKTLAEAPCAILNDAEVRVLDREVLEHPNRERYGGQRSFVVRRDDYVYLVPFVADEHTVLHPSAQGPRAGGPAVLKTIIPSRKATKQYLGEEFDDEDGR
jgi:hypothetical protein